MIRSLRKMPGETDKLHACGRKGGMWLRSVTKMLIIAMVTRARVCTAQGANAVPPSTYTQPLYVCKMEVSDLPEYDGYVTPDMQAASIGLRSSLAGMLEPWFITDNFGTGQEDEGSQGSSSANVGRDRDAAGGAPKQDTPAGPPEGNQGSQQPGRKVNPPNTGQPGDRSNRPGGSAKANGKQSGPPGGSPTTDKPKDSTRSTTPVEAPLPPTPPAAVAPSPPPPRSYIIPRPASPALLAAKAAAAAVATAAAAQDASKPAAAAAGGTYPAVDRFLVAAAAAAAAAGAADVPAADRRAKASRAVEPAAGAAAHTTDINSFITESAGAAGSRASPTDLPPNTSPQRQLLQTDPGREVCNKGTPTISDPPPFVKKSINATYGEVGITMAQTNVIPPDATLAVGPAHAIHVVNSLVKIIPLTSSGSINLNPRLGDRRLIPLPDWFALVASPCTGGYIYPAATYDKEIGRFLITAICGYDSNQILLAVSSTPSAVGTWILYSFPGEVTQGTQMGCPGYPVSLQSQVTYNQDGVYISFVQNCPDNQETATGAILFALPKWAVYKGATFFYVPVWTAWDIYNATGMLNTEALYPGAFLQLQPVIPQRAEDVQAEVVYFVSDNLNYVFPLQRTEMTVAALINTGSLWLYEGPNSNAPSPLLVSRVIGRGIGCLAVPDTKLVQPLQVAPGPDAVPLPSQQCDLLDAGAMRPPGFWDGGAALFANKIYLADRGPDIISEVYDLYGGNFTLSTIYWAVLTPSFCVSGPCAPFFGSDWGWSDGWDWNTGTWAADSERAKTPYTDPSFYNQVFLFPNQATSGSSSGGSWGRRKLQTAAAADDSDTGRQHGARERSHGSSERHGSSRHSKPGSSTESSRHASRHQPRYKADSIPRDAIGVPFSGPAAFQGSVTAAAIQASMGPIRSREEMLAAVQAALERMEANIPSAETIFDASVVFNGSATFGTTGGGAGAGAGAYPGVDSKPLFVASVAPDNATSSSGSARVIGITAGRGGDKSTGGSESGSASANNLFVGGTPGFQGWTGWGYNDATTYYSYYQFWREHYFLRNLYMNLRIPPKINPCKYYKDWQYDNTVTFGALVSRRGVLDYVTNQANPVGVAYPQVAVVGGSMLIVYSFSGPLGIPDSQGAPKAYPGIGYSFIPPDGSNGNYQIQYAKLPGFEPNAGCVEQHGMPQWGYSGIDIHYPSQKVLSAVETSWGSNQSYVANSNAATWINVFS